MRDEIVKIRKASVMFALSTHYIQSRKSTLCCVILVEQDRISAPK